MGNSLLYLTPAHVVLFNNSKRKRLEVSDFMNWSSDCEWFVPTGYDPNRREPKLTDLAWAKVPESHNRDEQCFLELSDKKFNSPQPAHLFFRQPYDEQGKWLGDRSELAAKDAVVYKSPNSELLEAIDIGFRGLSGAIATEKDSDKVVGLFIRKGKAVALKTTKIDLQLQALKDTVSKKEISADDIQSEDTRILYKLLKRDITNLQDQIFALDQEVLKRQHLEEVLNVAALRRGLLLPCSAIVSLVSGQAKNVKEWI